MTTCPLCGSPGYTGLASFECDRATCANHKRQEEPTATRESAKLIKSGPAAGALGGGSGGNNLEGLTFEVPCRGNFYVEQEAPSWLDFVQAELAHQNAEMLERIRATYRDNAPAVTRRAKSVELLREPDGFAWVVVGGAREPFSLEDWDDLPDHAGKVHATGTRTIHYEVWARHIAPLFTADEHKHAALVSRARVAEKRAEDMAARHHRIVAASGFETSCAYPLDAATDYVIAKLKGTP